ncbi:MAG: hypothetical protein M5R36_11025 [Deltaproteobacteria bacterium]|nr:hypothetical protein [Deltaproteobacteria bacterium]
MLKPRLDADAGVGDVDNDVVALPRDAEGDAPAVGGEFRGVRKQIVENLLELGFVRVDDQIAQLGSAAELERDVVVGGLVFDDGQRPLGHVRDGEPAEAEFNAARFDFRHVQNVVDDVEQMFAGGEDIGDVLRLLFAERAEV